MNPEDSGIRDALSAAEVDVLPSAGRMEEVRGRMLAMSRSGVERARSGRRVRAAAALMLGVCGVMLGTTEAGRNLIRWAFTPVTEQHSVSVTTSDGRPWTRTGSAAPYSPEEKQLAADQFEEVSRMSAAGLGELTSLYEVPGQTIYMIRYELQDGSPMLVGSSELTEKQAANMAIDELMALRDSGGGAVIAQGEGPLGLGLYTIRYELSDRTVDLETWYPPSTREEREAIFAETRRLKESLRFTVDQASVSPEDPEGRVFGTLRYTLADGRSVGIIEEVPEGALSEDGTHVTVPDSGDEKPQGQDGAEWKAPDGGVYTMSGMGDDASAEEKRAIVDEFKEVYQLKQAGEGQLVGLLEGPGLFGERTHVTYRVEYMLGGGKSLTMGEGDLSVKQMENMRIEELFRLRDSGAGEVVSESESRMGLGRFTIRFTLSSGEAVELETSYPPSTAQEREVIFDETRGLKSERRFSVEDAQVGSGAGVWGHLIYTLSDGRRVGHYEQVPSDVVSNDGRRIVIPSTGEWFEIDRSRD